MPISYKSFYKYQGTGNDFILFEDFEENFPISEVSKLCHRQYGIGADGLILVRHSKSADFQMVFFNADGKTEKMCGNGLRCFVQFLVDSGKVQSEYLIEISEKYLTVKRNHSKIYTFLQKPVILHWDIKIKKHSVFVVNTGVPHAVVFLSDSMDILQEGKYLRTHELFQPEGVNVNFVKRQKKNTLWVETYERGVEKVTLSCGTGVGASAFVAQQLGYCQKEVKIWTKSREALDVHIGEEIVVGGFAAKTFEGTIFL